MWQVSYWSFLHSRGYHAISEDVKTPNPPTKNKNSFERPISDLKSDFFIHTTSDDQRPDTEPADRRFVNSYVAQKGNWQFRDNVRTLNGTQLKYFKLTTFS